MKNKTKSNLKHIVELTNPAYFVTFLFIYSVLVLYFFPYGTSTFRFGFPISIFIFLLSLFYSKVERFDFKDLVLVLVTILAILSESSHLIAWTITICLLIWSLSRYQLLLSKKHLQYLLYACAISIIVQSLYHSSSQRLLISLKDPNFTAMYLILLLYFARKLKSYFMEVAFAIMIIMTLSRGAFLALVIFYLLTLASLLIKPLKRIRLNSNYLFLIFIGFNISFLLLSIFATENSSPTSYDHSWRRFFNLYDSASYERLKIVRDYLREVMQRPYLFFSGWGENYLIYFNNKYGEDIHNSFFALCAKSGVLFSCCYHFCIIKSPEKSIQIDNFLIQASYIFLSLVLHGGYETFPVIFLLCILSLKTQGDIKN